MIGHKRPIPVSSSIATHGPLPRLQRRGPIEAILVRCQLAVGLPRLQRRGPVEATTDNRQLTTDKRGFHDSSVVAPLKPSWSVGSWQLAVGLPRLQRRGPLKLEEIGDRGHNADPRIMPAGVLRVMRHPPNQAGSPSLWDTLPLTRLGVMQGASRLLSLGGWSVPGRAREDRLARRPWQS